MQILTFILNNDIYGVDIGWVDSIESKMPITPVPKSKAYMMGLVSNRGIVIPVIDTLQLLSRSEGINSGEKYIVVQHRGELLALAVDEIDDVFDVEEDQIEAVQAVEGVSVVTLRERIVTLVTEYQLKSLV